MEKFELKTEDFGEFIPFIQDKNVTDIDYNGYSLWITDLKRGRYKSDVELTETFLLSFARRIADYVNKQFNQVENVLEAQTDNLRITITHQSISVTGVSIEIRKALPETRHTIESMVTSGYCELPILNLLINCVKARMNFVFCGEPGVGKTECGKFFAQFIPKNDRIITLEDNLEMHLHEIYPEKDVVELLVNDSFGYQEAIAHCLRKHPNWIILSETRGEEAKYLLQQWSSGLRGFTTLHVDDLRNLPDRYMNMIGKAKDAERLENAIYEYISFGVQIRQRINEDGRIKRYMDQVAIYDRSHGKNTVHLIVNDGQIISEEIPERILWKLKKEGINEPFKADETIEYEKPIIDLKCVKEENIRHERKKKETKQAERYSKSC